ncbi:MAG TPA: ATP-binding protein [Solirubrobacteraceae bacterium]|jgi:signal transduction histidine kinase|nr:ATP-binding protein [Solirubrobacteraceae bacterium]
MREVKRSELGDLVERIVTDISKRQRDTGPHAIQCIGAELSAGAISAKNIALTNPKRTAREKPTLEALAKELRSSADAVEALRASGTLAIDLRDHDAAPSDQLLPVRYFYAHSGSLPLAPASESKFSIHVWGFTSQQPSTPFTPLGLRVAYSRLRGALIATYGELSLSAFTAAVRAGALSEALDMLTRLYDLAALALWQYDDTVRHFLSIATAGIDHGPLSLPAHSPEDAHTRGIVSQLKPDGAPVVYDTQDSSLWRPRIDGVWEPFDTALFRTHGWRSCIALPVISGGRLVGALSAYSRQSANVYSPIRHELARVARFSSDAILVQREETAFAALTARYEEELLTANVSLSALSLSHDVLHYYRTVEQHVEEATGYLRTGQQPKALEALAQIETTTRRTEPVIRAMRRLATEARSSRSKSEVQLTQKPDELLGELEKLLQVILPPFSRSRRLTPDSVVVAIEGPPRPIRMSAMSLERIVVNLCVNSAQWNAAHVWVTAHFDRSLDEVHIVVRDDGRGIAPSHRARVFDRFFSARKGSGLGLYVVKSLASRAGGDVHLQSYDYSEADEKRGTAITVVLPTEPE